MAVDEFVTGLVSIRRLLLQHTHAALTMEEARGQLGLKR